MHKSIYLNFLWIKSLIIKKARNKIQKTIEVIEKNNVKNVEELFFNLVDNF